MSDNTLHSAYLSEARTHLIFDLVSGKLAPAAIWKKKEYRLKFLLRTALFYRPTTMMLSSLSRRADFEQLLSAQVTLPSKPHRQYLSLGLSAMQRAQAIIGHYQFIDALNSPSLAQALCAPVETPLLTLTGKDDSRFTLYASCAGKAEREGESTLWLYDDAHTLLASATFSVLNTPAGRELVIGGLQGPRRSVSHEVIKLATRNCYGLFPKRILLECFGLLATHGNISGLSGVSDNGHVFRALRYRLSKGKHFHASYDEFWASVDGVQQNRWRWQLPVRQPRKALEEIASKKRAEYRRRFALLDEMEAQFAQLMSR